MGPIAYLQANRIEVRVKQVPFAPNFMFAFTGMTWHPCAAVLQLTQSAAVYEQQLPFGSGGCKKSSSGCSTQHSSNHTATSSQLSSDACGEPCLASHPSYTMFFAANESTDPAIDKDQSEHMSMNGVVEPGIAQVCRFLLPSFRLPSSTRMNSKPLLSPLLQMIGHSSINHAWCARPAVGLL